MGKEPCENCGLTKYNFVRKCQTFGPGSKNLPRAGCGKFGCDLCFHSPMVNSEWYFCPDCLRKTDGQFRVEAILFVLIIVIGYYVLVGEWIWNE